MDAPLHISSSLVSQVCLLCHELVAEIMTKESEKTKREQQRDWDGKENIKVLSLNKRSSSDLNLFNVSTQMIDASFVSKAPTCTLSKQSSTLLHDLRTAYVN